MIDIPPLWLIAMLALCFWSAQLGWRVFEGIAALRWLGAILILVGLGLMASAVWEMARNRTTVIPHQRPQVLVTSGIFRMSRNPIYLGDVCVLIGATLYWGAVMGLILVPVFVWILRVRFIQPEEDRLAEGFGAAYDAYANRTKRWI